MDYWRGHKIELIDETWVYSDSKKPVSENISISCGHCGKPQTIEGHDGCVGSLKKVKNACCGHGHVGDAYVQFDNDVILRGTCAVEYIKINRK